MNALNEAKRHAENADWKKEADDPTEEAQLALMYAAIAQAEATERIAMHLGNIHQALMTPDAAHEPVTVADLLTRIADALKAAEPQPMVPGRWYIKPSA